MPDKPIPKPYTVEQFKKSADTLLQGIYGTGPSSNDYLIGLIQETLDKGVKEGVITMQEGLGFLKERKNYYDSELGKQEGEKKRVPPAYGEEVEERVNFLDGGDTEYNSMVTKKYIELGGKEGTGMDIDKFAEEYFPKMAEGGRIGFAKGNGADDELVIVEAYGPEGKKLEKTTRSHAIKYGLTIVDEKEIDSSVLNKKNGGRIGFDKGTMPKSERWMRDYFFSGKGGYDDRMSYQEFALGPGQELFKRFNKKNGGVMYGKYAKQILSS